MSQNVDPREEGSRHRPAASHDDASTPLISNRALVPLPPPPIALPEPSVPESTSHKAATQIARFSCPNEEPLLMKHAVCVSGMPHAVIREHPTERVMVKELLSSRKNVSAELVKLLSCKSRRWKKLLEKWSHDERRGLVVMMRNTVAGNRRSSSEGDRRVSGLRNYGQTCFLNSVLQALASLQPFMMYLERLLDVNRERFEFKKSRGELQGDDFFVEIQRPSSFSALLFDVLQSVNGITNDIVDTRSILVAIGEKHEQFRAKYGRGPASVGKEQQDAEELMQALIDIVVEEAQFNAMHSSVPSSFLLPIDEREDDFLTIGAVVSERMKKPLLPGSMRQTSPISVCAGATMDTRDVDKLALEPTVGHASKNPSQPEEKKQEEFELFVPRVDSEDNIVCVSGELPLEQVEKRDDVGVDTECESESTDDTSLKRHKLSASMRIVMTTTSSISPSPLCAWIGSALQCRLCKHVRPIQNSPLFDLPVVPTAVSNLLSGARKGAPQCPPEKSDYGRHQRPCTLEECLRDFTSVEVVHDVECRFCTLERERKSAEEEALFLREAVATLLARARKTQRNLDDLKDLQDDLDRAEKRLASISLASPDGEEPLNDILQTNELDGIYQDVVSDARLDRHDSYKCLLITRLPSVLAIHVQRRYYDPNTNRMCKTSQHVWFPEILDVSPFCAYGGGSVSGPEWAGSRPQETIRRPIHYRLLSVIEHHGGAFSGHYVCYRRDPTSGRWLFASDNTVRFTDWAEVSKSQAYMLFYEAISPTTYTCS